MLWDERIVRSSTKYCSYSDRKTPIGDMDKRSPFREVSTLYTEYMLCMLSTYTPKFCMQITANRRHYSYSGTRPTSQAYLLHRSTDPYLPFSDIQIPSIFCLLRKQSWKMAGRPAVSHHIRLIRSY